MTSAAVIIDTNKMVLVLFIYKKQLRFCQYLKVFYNYEREREPIITDSKMIGFTALDK
jgi:hypothetical protein